MVFRLSCSTSVTAERAALLLRDPGGNMLAGDLAPGLERGFLLMTAGIIAAGGNTGR